MKYVRGLILSVCVALRTRCVEGIKEGFVQINTTKPEYHVGDNVTLTCSVNITWMLVTFIRNGTELSECVAPPYHFCTNIDQVLSDHTNYKFKQNQTLNFAWLEITNVSKEDSGVDFACHWTVYRDHVSFLVIDKPETQHTAPNKDQIDSTTTGDVIGIVVSVLFVVAVLAVIYHRVRNKQCKTDSTMEGTLDSLQYVSSDPTPCTKSSESQQHLMGDKKTDVNSTGKFIA